MLTIVSGASSNHFKSLKNFILSVKRFESNTPLIIYNLGLTATEITWLENQELVLKHFDFSLYPDFCNINTNAGCYAWKPIIIANTLLEVKHNVLWLDAGCLIYSRLQSVRNAINDFGIYSPDSSAHIAYWTHENTSLLLRVNSSIKNERNVSGGVVGVSFSHVSAKDIIMKWKRFALNKSIIAPIGSTRENHRQDQSILSILMRTAISKKYIIQGPPYLLGITIHNDAE